MSDDLQFERADYDPAAATCARCHGALAGSYFEIAVVAAGPESRARVCASCATALNAIPATPRSRLIAALAWGLLAAVVGSLLYYGVYALTGYELGLISIVVGVAVGAGVRHGSRGVGGLGYQLLAVALTYLSIIGAYYVVVLVELHEKDLLTGSNAFAVVPYTLAAPFMSGTANLLGILIIGFGLYQAWKLNVRKPGIAVAGPFSLDGNG